jgi:hypothetical protein
MRRAFGRAVREGLDGGSSPPDVGRLVLSSMGIDLRTRSSMFPDHGSRLKSFRFSYSEVNDHE